jgi:hypothetical protein
MRDHPLRSVLLLLVAVPQAAAGAWAVLAPRDWYASFPGLGHAWVAAYGPFEEHLAVDAGAGLLTLGLLLAWAAIVARPPQLRMALAAFSLFAAVHLGYHLRTLGRIPSWDDAASIGSLALALLVPLGVLLSLRPLRRPAQPAPEVA